MLYRQKCYSTSLLAFAAAELLIILFNTWNSVRQCFFALHTMQLLVFAAVHHMTELITSLKKTVFKQTRLVMLQYRMFDFFHKEWQQMRNFAGHTNQQIVSPLLFTTFATNIALNLVMIGNLLFRSLYNSEKIVMLAILFLQTFLVVLCSLGVTSWSSCFAKRSTFSILSQAQQALLYSNKTENKLYKRVVMTVAKIKLMKLFEHVCSYKKEEFCFTVGPLGKVNRNSLYEFTILYSSLVMYVAKMIRRGTM